MQRNRPWYTVEDGNRDWEEHYREPLRTDRIVRTTHGVDCGGGCELELGVCGGKVIWERPAVAPGREAEIGVRYCALGPAASLYLDPDHRLPAPQVRVRLLEAWRRAVSSSPDPVTAWRSIREHASVWKAVRGRGGFAPAAWSEVLTLLASAMMVTLEEEGAEAISGWCGSPGRGLVGAAAGRRFLSLLGARTAGFPPEQLAGRQVLQSMLGEAVDAPAAAAWQESELIVILREDFACMAAPDFHFVQAARTRGAPVWLVDEVPSQTWRQVDEVVRLRPEHDADWWNCLSRRLLEHVAGHPARRDELARLTDAPLLLELAESADGWRIRSRAAPPRDADEAGLVWDRRRDAPVPAQGSQGLRRRNLHLSQPEDDLPVDPLLTPGSDRGERVMLVGSCGTREVPVFRPAGAGGPVWMTVFDLLRAELNAGDAGEDDGTSRYSSSWLEARTGIPGEVFDRFAGQWCEAAGAGGRCLVLAGPSLEQYGRTGEAVEAVSRALMLSGSFGVPGGGFGWYAGQHKIIPREGWDVVAGATDWIPGSARLDPSSAAGVEPVRAATAGEGGRPPRITVSWMDDGGHQPPDSGQRWFAESPGLPEPRPAAPELSVQLTFRMDLPALYADIVLPTATWFEKDDLNSSDRTGRLVAQQQVVPPLGEARTEWRLFSELADVCAGLEGSRVVLTEFGVERSRLGDCFRTSGPQVKTPGSSDGSAAAALAGGSLATEADVCRFILQQSSATSGRCSAAAFRELEELTGLDLGACCSPAGARDVGWEDLLQGGRSPLPAPAWSGLDSAPYTPFLLNRLHGVPWSTPTGRMQFCHGAGAMGTISAAGGNLSGPAPEAWLAPAATGGTRLRRRLLYAHCPDRLGSLFADLSLVRGLAGSADRIWVRSEDAALLSLRDGDWVRAEIPGRRVLVRCRVSPMVPLAACILELPVTPTAPADCPGTPWDARPDGKEELD